MIQMKLYDQVIEKILAVLGPGRACGYLWGKPIGRRCRTEA